MVSYRVKVNRKSTKIPRYSLLSYGRRAFAVAGAGPAAWNSLSDDLRDPTLSTDSFRRLLKRLICSQSTSTYSALEVSRFMRYTNLRLTYLLTYRVRIVLIAGDCSSKARWLSYYTHIQSVKTMVSMVVIYALCWLPLHSVTVLGDIKPSIWNFEYIQLVWIACHWLAVSSCCWNPIVYYWTNDTLRAGFTLTLSTWCPCVRRPATPPTTHRRQVVYQSTLRVRGSYLQVDSEFRRPATCVRRSTTRLYYRARRMNYDRSNNVELHYLRAPTSAGCSNSSSSHVPPVAETRSY